MLRRLLVLALLVLAAVAGGRIALLVAAAGTPDASGGGDPAALASGAHRVGLVFGAGVNLDGSPSALLRDRIRAGKTLLDHRQVDLLLMTGDHSVPGYNEPGTMRKAAIALGIPAARIATDYGGRRTWDSCRRARQVFGVRRAITVSNDFHRARTVALCKAAGITIDGAIGTPTGIYPQHLRTNWEARELVASWRGVADAWIHHPAVPVAGKPIDPYDPCAVWRSLSTQDRASVPGTRPSGC